MIDRPPSPPTDPDIRFLDREELEALLRAVPDDHLGPTDRVLYLTAAMTGLRQGELLALRWRDVDWTAASDPRPAQLLARRVRPRPRAAARAAPSRSPTASPPSSSATSSAPRTATTTTSSSATRTPAAPTTPRKVAQALQGRRCARAGLRPVRFHDLRHTFGTRMAAAGAPLRTIQEWMGHRDYKTTLDRWMLWVTAPDATVPVTKQGAIIATAAAPAHPS